MCLAMMIEWVVVGQYWKARTGAGTVVQAVVGEVGEHG